jgi:ribose/xylose/arabinose/galactoside ABC-type transport system permease subunit
MNRSRPTNDVLVRWAPLGFLAVIAMGFGLLSSRFLSVENLGAILVQSSWLVVVALGMNFVLLTAGVDLSVGAAMYLAAVAVGTALSGAPVLACLAGAVLVAATLGALNGTLIVRLGLPPFIVTLSTLFVARGFGLFGSSTKIVYASPGLAQFGRSHLLIWPTPLWLATVALAVAWILMKTTAFGAYVRSIGADAEGARRAGVPTQRVTWWAYTLCGAFAGLGGFISLSQTSAASGVFGQHAEFLAIAAAVLGGTSLFGGRGTLWAPVVGAILITTVQNGLGLIDANPYAYPVITGGIIFFAAVFDTVRSRWQARVSLRIAR